MSDVIDKVKQVYAQLDKHNLSTLDSIYAADICFIDPATRIEGLQDLRTHFASIYENVLYCRFHYEAQQMQNDDSAFLSWQMQFAHPKLKQGSEITVQGASFLKFNERVYYHRDWFDMGQMLYEHVPLLGTLVGKVKKRVQK